MVHIQTEWCLRNEDVEQLIENGMEKKTSWWLKKLPSEWMTKSLGARIPANEKVDVDIDLADGEYQIGCGDSQMVSNTTGHGMYQKRTFYIENGEVHYCTWRELPSNGGSGAPAQTSWNNTKAGWGSKQEVMSEVKKEEYFIINDGIYCRDNACVNPSEFVCDDFEFNIPSDGSRCSNCKKGLTIYIKKE